MAKVKFSAYVSEIRGKANGSVFTKCKQGNTIRTKITPINRRTSYQTSLRSNFATIARAWAGLGEAVINAWNAAAAQMSHTNIFGDKVFNSGFNLFMELNRNLFTAGQAAITAPPSSYAVTGATLSSVDIDSAAGGTFTITCSVAAVPAGETCLVFVTPQLSPGVSNVNQKFVLLKTIATGGDIDAASIKTEYIARFGSLVAGKTIGVGVNFVGNTSGMRKVVKFKAGSDLASKVK